MADVTLVHLVWGPIGLEPVKRFIDAYLRYAPGCDHRLLLALNGIAGGAERRAVLDLFRGVDHEVFSTQKPIQDIPTYFAAARHVESELVCFVNSHSAPLATGWLAALRVHAEQAHVGVAGATASWESHHDNGHIPSVEEFPRTLRPRKWAGWVLRNADPLRRGLVYGRWYSHFPNPHIRTNAFMIRRSVFLGLRAGRLRTKDDALRFESGRYGMTQQLLARGLKPLVVGRDGVAYPPEQWPASRTFRSGDQENLLVADNRTRDYANADEARRRRLIKLAWRVDETPREDHSSKASRDSR